MAHSGRRHLWRVLLAIGAIAAGGATEANAQVVRVTDYGAEPGSRKNAVAAVGRALEACRRLDEAGPGLPEGPLRFLAPARRGEGLLRVQHHRHQPQAAGDLHRGLRRPDRGRRRVDLRLPRPDAAVHRGPVHRDDDPRPLDRLGRPPERGGGRRGRDRGVPRPADRRLASSPTLSRTAGSSSSGRAGRAAGGTRWSSTAGRSRSFPGPATRAAWAGDSRSTGPRRSPRGACRLHRRFGRRPAVGNVLVLRHSERDHAGVFVVDSRDVTVENVDLYHCAGLGLLAQFTENLTVRGLQRRPLAGPPRPLRARRRGPLLQLPRARPDRKVAASTA